MTIEQLLKAAHAANVVHFPQGIRVVRDLAKKLIWSAGFIRKDGTEEPSSIARAESPEAAIKALEDEVVKSLRDRATRAQRDADDADAMLAEFGVEETT